MGDHNHRIAMDHRTLGPKTTAEPATQNTNNLSAPDMGNKVHHYRHEFRNFRMHNPDIHTYAQFQAAMSKVSIEDPARREIVLPESRFYVNPARQYTPAFDHKVQITEKATTAALQIFEEKSAPKLIAAMRNLDPETIRTVSELYKAEFKADLNTEISKILKNSHLEKQHIEIILKGDKAGTIASELNLILSERNPSKERLKEIIKDLDPKVFEEVKVILKDKYEKTLTVELNPREIRIQELAEIIKAAPKNPEKFMEVLRKLPPEELKLIPEALVRVEKNVTPEVSQIAKAFAQENRPLAEAIYINKVIEKKDLTPIKITEALETLSKEDKVKFAEIYKQTFEKNPYNEIKTVLAEKPQELKAVKEVLEQSKIAESSKIYILVNEADKDKNHAQNLVKILEDKTAVEVNQIRQEIYRTYNVSLDSQLANNLQGKEQLLGRMALSGRPETLEDELIRRKAIYEFERRNKPIITEKVVKELTRKGKYLDEELEKLDEQHRQMEKTKDALSEDNELSFYCRLGIFDKKVKSYGDAKEQYNKMLEYIVAGISALIAYMMTNEFFHSPAISSASASAVFFSAKQFCRNHIKKSLSTEKALQNFRARNNKKKKSHRTRSRRRR